MNNTIAHTAGQKTRIEYIDCIKGFTILWVIIFHLYLKFLPPTVMEIINLPIRMPLFFFLSGFFFRQRPFKAFITKRVRTLIIPFVFFYVLGIAEVLFRYFCYPEIFAERTSMSVWEMCTAITGIFDLSYANSPVIVNAPLWFLITLFNVQMIIYGLNRLINNKYAVLMVCFLLFIAGKVLYAYEITGLFYIPTALTFIIYYELGNVFGEKIINLDLKKNQAAILYGLCIILTIGLFVIRPHLDKVALGIVTFLEALALIPLVFGFFKNAYKLKVFKPLSFMGFNSITIFGTHYLLITTASTIFYNLAPSIKFVAFLLFLIVMEYLLIKIINNYIPFVIGRQK